MIRLKQLLSIFLSCSIVLATLPGGLAYAADDPNSAVPVVSAQPNAQELQQLVAPIALYPDSLVAQILAAAGYPEQVVESDRWLQGHAELKGDQLASAVDQQNWDPSVKALTGFPSILANMDKNLSWTTSLGEAYVNNEQAVMDAVQAMRQNAKKAGNLKSTSQVNVSQQGQTIIIEPIDPEIVYVPKYDPWLVYGVPVAPWPGWYWYPGLYWTSPGIAFGAGFGIGFFGGYSWGWHHWHPDWDHHRLVFNHNPYVFHSRTVINHNYYVNRSRNVTHNSGGNFHSGSAFRGGPRYSPAPHAQAGGHGGAFGGVNHGGVVRGYSNRGFSSMGGFHGGGFHSGGGFHGGGRR